MCWVKAGSGKSLKLLKEKKVDIIMVHAPATEKKAIKEGWAIKRSLIGSNEFYIVGPKNDPARISSATSAADAYAKIASGKATFLSRGDNSGTNKKELSIWKTAGISPSGDWYVITKDQKDASKFIDFLNSVPGQKIIRDYGKILYGQGMYNDAQYAKKYDH